MHKAENCTRRTIVRELDFSTSFVLKYLEPVLAYTWMWPGARSTGVRTPVLLAFRTPVFLPRRQPYSCTPAPAAAVLLYSCPGGSRTPVLLPWCTLGVITN